MSMSKSNPPSTAPTSPDTTNQQQRRRPIYVADAFAPPASPFSWRLAIASSPSANTVRRVRVGNRNTIWRIEDTEFSAIKLRANINDDDDSMLEDEEEEDEEEQERDKLDDLVGKKLGINIGSQLPSLTQEELDDIKSQAQSTLDAAIDSRLADIDQLRTQLQEDAAESRSRMDNASKLNVQLEKQNLMEKIDRLSNDFLNKDKDFREDTKKAAAADGLAGSMGLGLDWGSWGNLGDGEVVVSTEISESERVAGASKLLGSVDAARRRGEMMIASSGTQAGDLDGSVATVTVPVENRVLVVVDDKKEKGSAPILNRLTTLLDEAFDGNIIVDTYSPSSNIPIGGNNAQTAIIFASSLNDRSSLETLLGRVLKRTAPVAGGAAGMPPSHVVLISALGTERTNKMPYSMQNLFGGKLDKLGEIERAIVAISRSRQAPQSPLDYTVVKLGEVASEDKAGEDIDITIQPGDAVDGEIGPNAAANVLMQAMAYQPYARNATLCMAGSIPTTTTIDTATWNDKFLCLSGPELLRVEAGRGADAESSEGILDAKYEQLQQYVKQWSMAYEGDRKGTGLTTPVLVRKSRKPPSAFDGVAERSGVRILFQTTNTGDRYKSASEEKIDEKERSGPAPKKSVSATAAPVMVKGRKEGGVEVLVEKTTDGNIRVRARRCNMDNKTIVKEMSEVVIVKSLKKAIEAWVNARATTGF